MKYGRIIFKEWGTKKTYKKHKLNETKMQEVAEILVGLGILFSTLTFIVGFVLGYYMQIKQ